MGQLELIIRTEQYLFITVQYVSGNSEVKTRRVAQSVPNIFYKLKKLQIKQIQNNAWMSLRKWKTKGTKYTAGDLKSDDYVNKLIHQDERI